MKERLIDVMSKEYSDYEIDLTILSKLYDKMIKQNTLPKKKQIDVDYYYYYYFIFKNMIDNYIINEIKNGNKDYEIYLLLKTEYIVDKYYRIKKDSKKIDKLADMVLEECLNSYDKDENYDKQAVKQITKKIKG